MSIREKLPAPPLIPRHGLELTPDDPRRSLVERIVASPSFAKTERLTSFLTCVCELGLSGQVDTINEQYIGTTVFGRSPDYDPSVDSIVRSHASRLRHRLRQYFAEEGTAEELLLTIPKGAYLPVFTPRVTSIAIGPIATEPRPPEPPPLASTTAPQRPVTVPLVEVAETQPGPRRFARGRWLIVAALVVLCTGLAALAHLDSQKRAAQDLRANTRSFWNTLFNPNEKTIVVGGDSGLVLLQNMTKRRITLASYINGSYLKDLPLPPAQATLALDFAARRYTSVVDLWITNKILRLPANTAAHSNATPNIVLRYARDLRMNEIKQGNLVLLGTYESTPWVQLFEPSMNFYFQNDLAAGVFSLINRNPQPGEQSVYNTINDDPEHTIYGVVAYRPTLNGSGKVLILEGQSMAGTETASDFVFDDAYLLPFLNSIRRQDGSIPYFELLLRSRSISSEASRLEIVAHRVEER